MLKTISCCDKVILNNIQSNFPYSVRPYKVIANRLGISEDEVISSILRLKKNGVIRRIGGNFVPKKLGFVSTLCAAIVPEEKIESFSNVVNSFSGVTHNYLRDHKFNVWFTFIAESKEFIEQQLTLIMQQTDVTCILNLPATKVFKINAEFNL